MVSAHVARGQKDAFHDERVELQVVLSSPSFPRERLSEILANICEMSFSGKAPQSQGTQPRRKCPGGVSGFHQQGCPHRLASAAHAWAEARFTRACDSLSANYKWVQKEQTLMRIKLQFILALLLAAAAIPAGAQSTATINFGTTSQTIRGFGGATAWMPALSSTQANALFGTGAGQLGLTIHRMRIDDSSTTGGSSNWGAELTSAQAAAALGAINIASPWGAPAVWKSNNNTVQGSLLTSHYADYANYLESFVTFMKNGGVNLYAISMQNEPDATVTYDSMVWNGSQMDTWVANNSSVLTTKLMMPESESFITSLSDPALNDSNAVGKIGIIAGHIYGVQPSFYSNAVSKGKEVWMTEHYLTPSGSQPAIGDAIAAAEEVHNSLVTAQYNAYVWWWILDWNPGNGVTNFGLIDTNSNPTYYGYALAQFSKFVRPGYVRVSATANPNSNVFVSAYKGSTNSVIVAINGGGSAVNQPFSIQNQTVTAVTPFQTTSSAHVAQLSNANVTNNAFTYTLPAQSITTFVTTSGGGGCMTVPSAPSSANASTVSSSSILVGWSAVTPPSGCSIGYNVFRSTTSGFTPSASNQVATGLTGTSFTDTGLAASTTYFYKIEAVDGAGSSAASPQASATTQSGGGTTLSIDAGGAASGSWVADEDFSGGTAFTYTNSVSTAMLSGTIPPPTVLQSQRFGNNTSFTYTIPGYTAGSSHSVTLYFVENFVTASGRREFNVIINGSQVLTNFDVFAAAGGQFRAIQRSFNTTANNGGQIVIQFTLGAVQNPMVSGISIQ